jgi:hypothetical protein
LRNLKSSPISLKFGGRVFFPGRKETILTSGLKEKPETPLPKKIQILGLQKKIYRVFLKRIPKVGWGAQAFSLFGKYSRAPLFQKGFFFPPQFIGVFLLNLFLKNFFNPRQKKKKKKNFFSQFLKKNLLGEKILCFFFFFGGKQNPNTFLKKIIQKPLPPFGGGTKQF